MKPKEPPQHCITAFFFTVDENVIHGLLAWRDNALDSQINFQWKLDDDTQSYISKLQMMFQEDIKRIYLTGGDFKTHARGKNKKRIKALKMFLDAFSQEQDLERILELRGETFSFQGKGSFTL